MEHRHGLLEGDILLIGKQPGSKIFGLIPGEPTGPSEFRHGRLIDQIDEEQSSPVNPALFPNPTGICPASDLNIG